MRLLPLLLLSPALIFSACDRTEKESTETDTDTDSDSDGDGDSDTDTDSDTDLCHLNFTFNHLGFPSFHTNLGHVRK